MNHIFQALNLRGSRRPERINQVQNPSSPRCAALWERLSRFSGGPAREVVSPNEVGSNVPGVHCLKHSAVGVTSVDGEKELISRIHANRIKFELGKLMSPRQVSVDDSAIVAVAGQSPQRFDLVSKFLAQGLDSGNGLF